MAAAAVLLPEIRTRTRAPGTSGRKCPNARLSTHIAAHFAAPPFPTYQEGAANSLLLRGRHRWAVLIAMQKVVGSNPISRFAGNPP